MKLMVYVFHVFIWPMLWREGRGRGEKEDMYLYRTERAAKIRNKEKRTEMPKAW